MAFFRRHAAPAGDLWLVAGLGNPGPEYAGNRHNAGFRVVSLFRSRHGLERPRRRYDGRWTEGDALGRRVGVLLPQTFMNLSGRSVREAARKKHIPPDRLIVVHDELDFPFGVIRCRLGGGAGGHNGVASIISALATQDFHRVRVGIGRPDDPGVDPREWVLTDFQEGEEELGRVFEAAADCVDTILSEGIDAAMQQFNRRD